MMTTLHERVRDIYICKVAERYGVICVVPWDGKFYFEGVEQVDAEREMDRREKTSTKILLDGCGG